MKIETFSVRNAEEQRGPQKRSRGILIKKCLDKKIE